MSLDRLSSIRGFHSAVWYRSQKGSTVWAKLHCSENPAAGGHDLHKETVLKAVPFGCHMESLAKATTAGSLCWAQRMDHNVQVTLMVT